MNLRKSVALLLSILIAWLFVLYGPTSPTVAERFQTDQANKVPTTSSLTLAATRKQLKSGEVRFAVIGDFGADSTHEALVASMVSGWNPDFVITTGDNNYPSGAANTIDKNIGKYYSQFIGDYEGGYGSGSPTNRFWPSLGNHDWRAISCSSQSCSGPHQDYFTLPGNERYYAVDYGLVHLYAVNSNGKEPDGNEWNSPQAKWLHGALAASSSCFDIVYFHHPPLSSGEHGSSVVMRWPFAEWGAEAILSGHEHSYERLDVSGMPYFVNGAGGRSLYGFPNVGTLPDWATSVVRYNSGYGAMLITVTEIGLISEFYADDGKLIDTYTLEKTCSVAPTASPSSIPSTSVTPDLKLTATPTNTPRASASGVPAVTPEATVSITSSPTPNATVSATPVVSVSSTPAHPLTLYLPAVLASTSMGLKDTTIPAYPLSAASGSDFVRRVTLVLSQLRELVAGMRR